MSSILRALKKLEDENAARQARTGWPQGVRPYTDLHATRGSRPAVLVTAAVLLLAILLAGGWWLWQDSTTTETSSAATSALPPLPAPLPAEPPDPPHPTLGEKTSATASPPRDLGQRPKPAPFSQAMGPQPLPSPVAEATSRTAGRENLPAPSPATPVEHPEPPPEILILDLPELTLQAIAWSDTPQKRVAIIGNRIIKEGEDLNDFTVVRINPDDILVRRDTTTWKVVFKNR